MFARRGFRRGGASNAGSRAKGGEAIQSRGPLDMAAPIGVRPPRAAGPRAPHTASKPVMAPLLVDLGNREPLLTPTMLPRGSEDSHSLPQSPVRDPRIRGQDVISTTPSGARTPLAASDFGLTHPATNQQPRNQSRPTARPYTPGSFGGRPSLQSTMTYGSHERRQSLNQTHMHVQDGETLVGSGPGGRFSYASSTLRSVGSGGDDEGDSNPFKMSAFHDTYVSREPEEDDWLHEVKRLDGSKTWRRGKSKRVRYDFDQRTWRNCCCCSARTFGNVVTLIVLTLAIFGVLLGYPLFVYLWDNVIGTKLGFGLGGTNKTGQVADFGAAFRHSLIDFHTPEAEHVRLSLDGKRRMNLVFSDEFNVDGRSFYPGDDPIWEALDEWYWQTGDYEWYDPAAITTHNGSLVITISEHISHNKRFRSGVVTSWNKFCYQGGLLEASVLLPGVADVASYWPAIWTMGNLGRAGYGATTDGTWPYTYSACDVGTLRNQTWPKSRGGGPEAALTTGKHGGSLSYLPGQKLSSCTCPGEDHPGPVLPDGSFAGRGAPEIDLFESASASYGAHSSLSIQTAPFNAHYEYNAEQGVSLGENTRANAYKGGIYQQSVSAIHPSEPDWFQLSAAPRFVKFSMESRPGKDGFVSWAVNGQKVWTVDYAKALAADKDTQISSRWATREPMYIIMNLAMSSGFSHPEWDAIKFPGKFKIDWIRLYQDEGQEAVGCDPDDYPTKAYIDRHYEAYHNPNLTTWTEPRGVRVGYGHAFPKNRLTSPCPARDH